MKKKTFLPLITGLLLCFIAGCKESAPVEKPVVVKKSINQTSTTTPAPEAEKPETAAETPAPKAPETTAPAAVETKAEETSPAAAKMTAPVAEAPVSTVKETAAPTPAPVPAEPPAGTTDDTVENKAPAAQAEKTATAGDQEEQPAAAEGEEVSLKISLLEDDTTPRYDPTGKIDPFAALFSDKQDDLSAGESEPKRPLTPLEKIDISQLKLVAVLQAKSGDRAMVEDATGKPYILSSGTYIGINSGTVTKILKDRVVIEEKTKDILGRETSSTRELKLQKPLGEE